MLDTCEGIIDIINGIAPTYERVIPGPYLIINVELERQELDKQS